MTGTPLQTPAISLEGVKKTYKGFELGPMDLTVESGCIVAVVGPNGGGKSTLFGMLMNLIQPDSGELSLFGLAYPQDEVEIKQRVGYVPERSVGHDEMSANSLGEFVSYWYPGWDQDLYQDLLLRYEVDPDKRFGELSREMQRRLSFAVAMATGPELLLLDEPTAGVDPFARSEMLEDISRFMDDGEGRTVVFATQVVEEARHIADQVVLLADGEFLGPYQKDTLLDGWQTFWLDREPEGDIPGVVEVLGTKPTRIVTGSPRETAEALSAQSVRMVRKASVGLEEILSHLMRRSREGRRA
jgi:ABC-2 type transport system ATP-binding protein